MIFSISSHEPFLIRKINSWLKGTETKTCKDPYIDFPIQVGKCLFAPFISLSIIVFFSKDAEIKQLIKKQRGNISQHCHNLPVQTPTTYFTNLKGLDISTRIKVYLHHHNSKTKDCQDFYGRILRGVVIPWIFPKVPQSSRPESLGLPPSRPALYAIARDGCGTIRCRRRPGEDW